MIAYHFLQADFRAGRGNEKPWEVGETRTITNASRISLCEYGYHFSRSLWEALPYASGPLACQVEVPDDASYKDDKGVAVRRKLIAAVNVDTELRLFACGCAERVLYVFERRYPNDRRPHMAIEVARLFARGQATRNELVAARVAAWDATGDAAWVAAGAAARVAARVAAGVAAWDAARDAAWDAAGVAAGVAARVAEQVWHRQYFEEMFGGIFG